jgi:hypothetical protein
MSTQRQATNLMELKTVAVHHPDTPGAVMFVNEEDFDPSVHRAVGVTAYPADAAPQWTMGMSPQRYLSRHPDGAHADLARRVIANGD